MTSPAHRMPKHYGAYVNSFTSLRIHSALQNNTKGKGLWPAHMKTRTLREQCLGYAERMVKGRSGLHQLCAQQLVARLSLTQRRCLLLSNSATVILWSSGDRLKAVRPHVRRVLAVEHAQGRRQDNCRA